MNNEFNFRQLKIILDKISRYQIYKIDIKSLIYDLEALLDCIKQLPQEWLSQVWDQWEILEITYASALDKEQHKFTQEQAETIANTLIKIN